MSQSNKATLERANDAVSKGDHEGFLAFCTEDTRWTFVGERTLEGKVAVREYMAETYREPPQFDVERMIAEHDIVAAMGKITLKDETGKATRYSYCDVWRLEHGKLAELHAYVVPIGDAE